MSLTDLYARARDGAFQPDVEAGLVLKCLVALAEDRRPIDLVVLDAQLRAITLEAPDAEQWATEVRELAEADDPEARALASACAALVERRDDLRPDQWGHLVGCLGAVWWLLDRLEPFLMATTRAA